MYGAINFLSLFLYPLLSQTQTEDDNSVVPSLAQPCPAFWQESQESWILRMPQQRVDAPISAGA